MMASCMRVGSNWCSCTQRNQESRISCSWPVAAKAALAKAPKALADALKAAERPAIIVGGGALRYEGVHGAALAFAAKYKLVRDGWNGFNVLHFAAARMGGLMLGYAHDGGIKALAAKAPKLAFFLAADEADYSLFAGSFKVYVGHHGDNGAHHSDVILPGAAYSEKSGTYVNLEGRVQRAGGPVRRARSRAEKRRDKGIPLDGPRSAKPRAQ